MRKPSVARAWLSAATHVPRRINVSVVRHATALGAWSAVIALVGVPLILLGGLLTYFQLRDYFVRPDIHLFVQHPADPMFRLVNPTTVLLREPKYQIALFDLDDPTTNGARSLEIPVKVLEWILPKSTIGPWTFSSLSQAAGAVPKSHAVFGWISIQCPNCEQPRHYWILIKRGETAWYSEIPPDEWPSITRNLGTIIKAGADQAASLLEELVPVEKRVGAQAG